MSSSPAYPPSEAPSDGEYPALWEHFSQLVASRQRILQALMAFYVQKNDCIEELYKNETKMGLPSFEYLPQTVPGKNALMKFTSACDSYKNVMNRYKTIFEL
jgi:hypothetical protein